MGVQKDIKPFGVDPKGFMSFYGQSTSTHQKRKLMNNISVFELLGAFALVFMMGAFSAFGLNTYKESLQRTKNPT
jgi:hypothetical protein